MLNVHPLLTYSQVSPNWELLVTSTLDGRLVEGPNLSDLPDELLPALSKFLFVAKDEAEQGTIDQTTVHEMIQIVNCLTIVSRKVRQSHHQYTLVVNISLLCVAMFDFLVHLD